MSRAFVKESDTEQAAEALPDRPQSPHPNYVTRDGFAALERRLRDLQERRRALEAADDALEAGLTRAQVTRDLRYLKARIERAIVVDPAAQPRDEVAFGATVEVEDDDGRRRRFTIVGEDEADAERGKVSWVSPLARALAGARVGDVVTWLRPAGEAELEILAIRYPAG